MHFGSSILIVAAFALAGCDVAPSPKGAHRATSAATPPVPASVSPPVSAAANSNPDFLSGLACDSAARSCTAPGYAISGSADACAADGPSFGAISDDVPVPAVSRVQGANPVASLAPGQFLCIHYTAQPIASDGEAWLYVTAISPEHVPACTTAHCGDPGASSQWVDGRSGPCTVQGDRYGAGCPAGWVRAASVDAYSMGL